MSCSNSTGIFDGGTWANPQIINPTVTGGTLTGSTLKAVSLEGMLTLDADATESIQKALCDTISECVGTVSSDTPPTSTATEGGNVLPDTIVGVDRSQLLGKPVTYLEVAGYLIPAYKAS